MGKAWDDHIRNIHSNWHHQDPTVEKTVEGTLRTEQGLLINRLISSLETVEYEHYILWFVMWCYGNRPFSLVTGGCQAITDGSVGLCDSFSPWLWLEDIHFFPLITSGCRMVHLILNCHSDCHISKTAVRLTSHGWPQYYRKHPTAFPLIWLQKHLKNWLREKSEGHLTIPSVQGGNRLEGSLCYYLVFVTRET